MSGIFWQRYAMTFCLNARFAMQFDQLWLGISSGSSSDGSNSIGHARWTRFVCVIDL